MYLNRTIATAAKTLLSALLLWSLAAIEVDAQYFGRNKVQYEDFNFQILKTPNFDIYHYPKEAGAVRDLGRLSERWYGRHSKMLDHSIKIRNPLIIYANHADFQQNDIVPRVSVGTGGVTEGLRNRVVMPFAEANQSTNHVLGHELVHAFQYDIARSSNKIGGIRATSQMPLWFIEGMAEYLSIGSEGTHTAMWLRDAVIRDDLPTLKQLSNSSEYFPYRYGHSVWAYIAGEWGDEIVAPLFVNSARHGLKKGFETTLDIPMDSVSTLWQNAVEQKYSEDVKARKSPSQTGKMILGKPKNTGSINVAPSISPDGEYVAFISEKNIFSIELFLADAETGEIVRKLTSTNADPHLNALRFIESAGTWSPDGDKFAAVVFAKGDNRVIIIDTETGETIRKIGFGDVDAITNPAWSPDGSRLAFSGSDGGYSDLYLYNFENDSLRNITGDKYSDLQPAWSPDGSRLAFVTDRGPDTDFDKLTFGNTVIGILNLQSGEVELLPEFYDSKHINPQFGPDGRSLYYISDYEGFSNVYRYDFSTGRRYQVTSVNTGVTGISKLSPAMTVADNTGDMLVSIFENSNYGIYRIPAGKTTGTRVLSTRRLADSAELPPGGNSGNRLMRSFLTDPLTDLPEASSFSLTDYTPKLTLDYVGGGAGVGVSSQFGVGAAGGVTLRFTDMLNQHQLITNLRMQGSYKDIGGQVAYLNRDNRFVYGVSVSHFPYRSTAGSVTRDTLSVDGQQVVAPSINRINRRVFQERISLLGQYPFSRTQRLEFSAGWTHIWYDLELQQTFVNQFGQPIERNTESLATPSPLNLYNASAAYVEDNSISAFTGPIRGHRLRLEVEPTTGSLSFLTALADYRKYFYMRPFTLAFRALHTGRYLQDSEDERLTPNFVGYESLVRGYNTNSFDARECANSPGEGCAVFNRLIGSRMGVANVEFRVPVLGAESLALFKSNTIPTTLNAFFDGGYAWTKNDPFSFDDLKWTTSRTAERIPVFSTGVSARVNVFGYLVAEVYYAVPFQRPDQNGYVGFSISPGW